MSEGIECSLFDWISYILSPHSKDRMWDKALAWFCDSFFECIFRSCLPLWKWLSCESKLEIFESTSKYI